jgi:hypothetical protein
MRVNRVEAIEPTTPSRWEMSGSFFTTCAIEIFATIGDIELIDRYNVLSVYTLSSERLVKNLYNNIHQIELKVTGNGQIVRGTICPLATSSQMASGSVSCSIGAVWRSPQHL